jgi:hypothetical protein
MIGGGVWRECRTPAVVAVAPAFWGNATRCRACLVIEFEEAQARGVEAVHRFKQKLRPLPGKPELQIWKLGPLRVLFDRCDNVG